MFLSARQKAFVQYYIVSLNATQAAVEAGYSSKYANRQGAQLLARPKIQAAIQKAMKERIARVEVDQDYVIQRLKTEAELEGEGASHGARIKALELLGKHLGMFTDRVQMELSGDVNLRAEVRSALLERGHGTG